MVAPVGSVVAYMCCVVVFIGSKAGVVMVSVSTRRCWVHVALGMLCETVIDIGALSVLLQGLGADERTRA